MAENLPIDIQTNKLVDWLISRRHIGRDWSKDARTIREKINNAIQDMPEHPEITELLSGTYINYFHCLRIVEILAETEKDSKNILGWYTSQRMKDWKEICHLYEKENIYLAEASQMLVRNVSYEIPAIKRLIAKCDQVQAECERKEADCVKNAINANNKYNELCSTIGIKGEKVKRELVELLKDLPEEFDKIAKMSQKLVDSRQFYFDFINFISPNIHTQCLPLLKFITDVGNVTVYEWTYGEPPISIEEPQIAFDLEDDDTDNKDDDIIDFGDEGGIDFGADVDLVQDANLEDIDWGNFTTNDADTIDFDVGTIESSISGITLEETGVSGGIARDNEALTVLMYHKTREQFINELLELEGFLTQRRSELESEGSVVSLNLFSDAPKSLQYQSKDSVQAMIHDVQEVISQLTSTKLQHLYLISSSVKYVDRLAASLKAKKAIGEKMEKSKENYIEKRKQVGQERLELQPKLQLFIKRTKELQREIEKAISKKYKNREVNLMGNINSL